MINKIYIILNLVLCFGSYGLTQSMNLLCYQDSIQESQYLRYIDTIAIAKLDSLCQQDFIQEFEDAMECTQIKRILNANLDSFMIVNKFSRVYLTYLRKTDFSAFFDRFYKVAGRKMMTLRLELTVRDHWLEENKMDDLLVKRSIEKFLTEFKPDLEFIKKRCHELLEWQLKDYCKIINYLADIPEGIEILTYDCACARYRNQH